jgi:hypothetical protein
MPMWGKIDQANNAPKNQFVTQSTANGQTAFNNTTIGALTGKAAVGMFGVTDAESQVSGALASPGWQKITQGTGPVVSFTVADGGSGYANSDLGVVSGGSTNANFTLTTNSTGGILTATLSNDGGRFLNLAQCNVQITNSTGGASAGSSANVVPVLGGRAGRIQYETLVALTGMSGDGSDDALLPDS